MATIKSYTDIEQSRKLAEILPLESADMLFQLGEDKYADSIKVPLTKKHWEQMMPYINPCWSLASLLNFLDSEIVGEEGETYQLNIEKDGTWWNVWYREEYDDANHSETESTEELIDACYEMILKLHELELL